ncbi:hypothetical protein EST38_g8652 [Candolleomyces aberdarensis]|uniref:Glycosyl hydrolase family 92 domain-containing protein n=1 Tax=Candolleomyces aberdarensis TaxID=2316362 RepID=A0A4Q2DBX0_9AGAR|nr:hypothetical protein EST38_g8652 [Candolleomyces aberdarensis]
MNLAYELPDLVAQPNELYQIATDRRRQESSRPQARYLRMDSSCVPSTQGSDRVEVKLSGEEDGEAELMNIPANNTEPTSTGQATIITGYLIRDTCRAIQALQILFMSGSVPQMLQDVFHDYQQNVDYEARAGVSSVYNVPDKGWVSDGVQSESVPQILDYVYDDYAAYTFAKLLNKFKSITAPNYECPVNPFNEQMGLLEARNHDRTWAVEDKGDKWAIFV